MAEFLTIAEVSRLTGLAPHTIRFYERQFPTLLTVERSPGGHRQYRASHLEALRRIIHLLRHEKLSIREAQLRLGESPPAPARPGGREDRRAAEPAVEVLQQTLAAVLAKLEDLSRQNAHLDALVEDLRRQASAPARAELLAEIARYREENRRSVRIYEEFLQRSRRLADPTPS
jgi:DNA-binding transcriptional MerR regulator